MNEEAEERGLLSVTPEIINPKGGVRRNSTGKVASRASLSLSNNEGKILPHYLRASTSSCHDFCKYGRKHAFESKGKHPTFSKFSGNSAAPEEERSPVKILNLHERQKKLVVKLKASLHPKIEITGRPKIDEEKSLFPAKTVISAQVSEIVTQNTPSLVKEIGSSEEPEIIKSIIQSPPKRIESPYESETIKQPAAAVDKIELYEDPEIIMQMTPPLLKKTESSEDPETIKQKRRPVKKIQLAEEPEIVEQTLSVKKPVASAKSKIKQKAPSPVERAITSVKPKFAKQTAPSPAKRFDASAKPAFSGKPKTAAVKSVSPLNPSTGIIGRINRESKVFKSVAQSKVGEKKVLKPPAASLSLQPPVNKASKLKLRKYNGTKSASPVKNQNKDGKAELENGEIKEKTLYVIEKAKPEKNENSESVQLKPNSYQSSPSSQSSSSSSPLSSSPSVSDHEEEEEQEDSQSTSSETSVSVYECEGAETNEVEFSKDEDKKSRRRVAMVHLEDKDQTPHKLKFTRGKVVNPQSENNGPRRLRFRQGKRVGENRNGKEVGRRSFRGRRELVGGDSNHPDLEAQTVVLRHRDMQDKKDTQGLFNHVIEETAIKLVETRKSKVKALVGAFETVISLQERKPAASF